MPSALWLTLWRRPPSIGTERNPPDVLDSRSAEPNLYEAAWEGTMLVEGRKALVTGSRRGIGRAIAAALAEAGADVGVNDIELDRGAEDTMDMVRRHGRTASWHRADISDGAQIAGMFDAFLETHGRIDILVNNAVGSLSRPFLDVTEEEWDYITGNALKGYFLCSQRAAREMAAQGGGGRIVSLSSVQAFRSWPGGLVYGVCKAGVSRMTMGMAHDLAGHGINCTAVAPGYIDSRPLAPEEEHQRGQTFYTDAVAPKIPAGRIGVPEDIAKVVLALCSPLGDYVNGQTITVDGGFLTGGTPDVEYPDWWGRDRIRAASPTAERAEGGA